MPRKKNLDTLLKKNKSKEELIEEDKIKKKYLEENKKTQEEQYNKLIEYRKLKGNDLVSLSQKKQIIEKVKYLDDSQREEIYKLVIQDTSNYIEKQDGIIINLDNLSNECMYKIYNYMKYNEDNNLVE